MMTITTVAPHANSAMSSVRILHCYLKETRYAFAKLMRNPSFWVPTLLFPVLFYLLIGYIFGAFKSTDPNVPFFMFCGFATMGAMTPGIFGFGITLAIEREQGLFRYKRAVPMPAFASLVASVAMSMVSVVLAVALLALAALSLDSVDLSIVQIITVTTIMAFGAIPFCAIGLFIGSITSGRAAPAIANLIYLPMIYFSGLFIPLPEGIRAVVMASPAFYLDQLALASIGAKNYMVGSAAAHVGILLGVTVAFLGLAGRRLAREG